MKQENNYLFLYLLGIIPCVWFGLLIAPFISDGMSTIIKEFPKAINDPFNIDLCDNSLKIILWT